MRLRPARLQGPPADSDGHPTRGAPALPEVGGREVAEPATALEACAAPCGVLDRVTFPSEDPDAVLMIAPAAATCASGCSAAAEDCACDVEVRPPPPAPRPSPAVLRPQMQWSLGRGRWGQPPARFRSRRRVAAGRILGLAQCY